MATQIIPFGTRCSSAFTIQRQLGISQQSMPFNWIDLHLKNMLPFVELREEQVETYMKAYFRGIGTHLKHMDGTHFPHDDINNERQKIEEKYVRRFKRFANVLESSDDLIFLTVLADDEHGTEEDFKALQQAVLSKPFAGGERYFITINLANYNFEKVDHYNFYVPLPNPIHIATGETFDEWEKLIAEKLKSNGYINEQLKKI